MPRRARVHFVSIKSSLVNLPISIYGPLLERSIRPQNLAVHLTLPANSRNGPSPKVEAYVGWTGMASASSLAHFNLADAEKGFETIEIDPQYATGLGLAQGDVVEIGLLHDLPFAKSVGTEPVSADDWEIIEIHATHVENTLLSQVRVANIGQEIDIWVLGRTRVRLKVVSLDPQSNGNALLLTTNTEVNIAPKLRATSRSGTSNKPYNTAHAEATTSTSSAIANAPSPSPKFSPKILRVIPERVLSPVHPPITSYTRSETLAYVSKLTFSQLTNSSFPLPGDSDISNREFFKATFRRLRPPVDPGQTPVDATKAVPPPAPRVLNAGGSGGGKGKAADDTAPKKVHEAFVGWAEDVPESHIMFPSNVRGVDDWDLVRIAATNERESSSQLFSNSDTVPSSNDSSSRVDSSSPAKVLAGVDSILNSCTDFCIRSFILHASRNVVLGVSGLLVTGRAGTGKTSIVQAVAKSLQQDSRTYAYTHYVDFARFSEQPIGVLKDLFRYWFEKAAWHRPSILIFDNMEKLLSVEVEHADSFRARHITELFLSQYSASARFAAPNSRGIILLGTAESRTSLHPLISSAHIFSDIIGVKPPNKDARKDILKRIVQRRLAMAPDIKQDPESPLNFAALATQTEGYSAIDLQDLVARAVHQAAIIAVEKIAEGAETILTAEDFRVAQVDFVPLSLRDIKLQKSDVAWSDIGGLKETRRILRETLEWPTKYGPIFAKSPLRLRSGLLLYGFPGCGKTLLASAVAKECGLNFISIKGPELLNKYIGASEKSVRDIFERASAAKPCVLFFDEFDSIAPKRGHDSTGVTDRVVNQMLTQMDGAEGLDGVYVLAATSRPDLIDSALLRPGRLDKALFCDIPDAPDRQDILQAVSRKVSISPSINWEEIAKLTEGFSGADLQALVYNAHLEVIHSSIATDSGVGKTASSEEQAVEYVMLGGPEGTSIASRAEESAIQRRLLQIHSKSHPMTTSKSPAVLGEPKKRMIEGRDLLRVLKSTRPSVSPEERVRLGRIYQSFVSDRSGGLPVPPGAGGVGNRVSLM